MGKSIVKANLMVNITTQVPTSFIRGSAAGSSCAIAKGWHARAKYEAKFNKGGKTWVDLASTWESWFYFWGW